MLSTPWLAANELHRQLGKRTAELEWAAKKLKSLDYETRKCLIESEPKNIPVIALGQQFLT
ncbi:hypothetical protein [Piscirickettsia salmonis]|uniref:hypothetical protein n=1 Tax=Piscirickettsia salmonis TaxID=1238 RepID=UPI001E44DFFB|nr:hypothetical protein [Piscirickettsia salmonis]